MILTKRNFRKEDPVTALFNEFFNTGFTVPVSRKPLVNIIESDERIELSLAAPGLNKDQIKIDIDDDLLHISASVEQKDANEGEKFLKKEFNFFKFKRTFSIPDTVETDKIEAKYENGILLIAFPKKEEVKGQKRTLVIS